MTAAVAAIADERNWPENWLNDSVAGFASHFDEHAEWIEFRQVDGVSVLIAPADLLLAMKLLAGRGRRDGPDIELLLDACGVSSPAEAEAIFDRYYPQDAIADGARRLLGARFSQ